MQDAGQEHIVIAGGTSGIGLATARRLAARGARVTATGRDPAKAMALAGAGIGFAQCDAADRAACSATFAALGAIDHLVVCVSGAAGAGGFRELDLADLRQGFEGKFWPQLNLLQAALGTLRPDGSATLVGAISARAGQPGTAGLAALNAALEAMVPVLASELRPLRINLVAPGVVDTPWWGRIPEERRRQLFDELGAAVPVGRVGTAEDIAQAIELAVTNTFITGTVIDCDGGWKLRR